MAILPAALMISALAAFPPLGTPVLAPTMLPEVQSTPEVGGDPAAGADDDESVNHLGFALDAGLPHGFGVTLVVRPWSALRFEGGVATNTAAPGVHGGVTLAPIPRIFTPTLTVEVGSFTQGDFNALLQGTFSQPVLQGLVSQVSYDYAAAHVGIEFGSMQHLTFYLRGGLAYVDATLSGSAKKVGTTSIDPGDVRLTLTMPSVKAGLTLYF